MAIVVSSCFDKLNVYRSNSRTTRHALPAANPPSGMSRVTTLPGPITLREPILTPGQSTAAPPTHTSAPISMGLANSCLRLSSAFSGVGCSVNLHTRPELRKVADTHRTNIEHDTIEVEEDPVTKLDIEAVVAIE